MSVSLSKKKKRKEKPEKKGNEIKNKTKPKKKKTIQKQIDDFGDAEHTPNFHSLIIIIHEFTSEVHGLVS